jgi:predicted Fe-S protein YdhL (DUF1289 family)
MNFLKNMEQNSVISPCIRICKLENEICIGCGRTRDQISKWRSYTDNEKLTIIEQIKDNHRQNNI